MIQQFRHPKGTRKSHRKLNSLPSWIADAIQSWEPILISTGFQQTCRQVLLRTRKGNRMGSSTPVWKTRERNNRRWQCESLLGPIWNVIRFIWQKFLCWTFVGCTLNIFYKTKIFTFQPSFSRTVFNDEMDFLRHVKVRRYSLPSFVYITLKNLPTY